MSYHDYMQRCEAEYFAALLVKHDGCVTAVARESGLTRTGLYPILRRHQLVQTRSRVGGNAQWQALQ